MLLQTECKSSQAAGGNWTSRGRTAGSKEELEKGSVKFSVKRVSGCTTPVLKKVQQAGVHLGKC